MKNIITLFLILYVSQSYASDGETNSSISASLTVAETLEALKKNPDVTIRTGYLSGRTGWTFASMRKGNKTILWKFVPEVSRVYPSVIKYVITEDGSSTHIDMEMLCEADNNDCEKVRTREAKKGQEEIFKSMQHSFGRDIKIAIYKAFGKDAKHFMLVNDSEKRPFAIYGHEGHGYEALNCEKSELFSIGLKSPYDGGYITDDTSTINVGLCGESDSGFSGALQQQRRIEGLPDTLMTDIPKELMRHLFQKEIKLGNNSRLLYFNIVSIGHGILAAPTVIIVNEDNNKLLIIQFTHSYHNMCVNYEEHYKGLRFCGDLAGGVEELGQMLLDSD